MYSIYDYSSIRHFHSPKYLTSSESDQAVHEPSLPKKIGYSQGFQFSS